MARKRDSTRSTLAGPATGDASEASAPVAARRSDFAARYPDSPELSALLAAFDAGDHAAVRAGALALERRTDDARVREAARDLRRRLSPHPLGAVLFALAVVLLTVLLVHYLGGHR